MRLLSLIKLIVSIAILSVFISQTVWAAKPLPISTQKLKGHIYFISGKGGNLGVSIGKDGTFLIDNQFADMSEVILQELKNIGGDTPRFVVNTHWHGDHTGGNANFSKKGSIIVAHNNVRKRLTEDKFIKAFNMKAPAQPAEALPVVTFTQEMSLYLNGDTVQIKHIADAHTDGDSVIIFKEANVIHTGDLFFNGFYPFIDTAHGGSLQGMAKAADALLSLTDDNTIIIPGHGPVANKQDLISYRDMLYAAYNKLSTLKKSGKSLLEVIEEKPLAEFDHQWANGLFSSDKWIGIVYFNL